eukprot:208362-Prymnesium_polylepis.1
MMHTCTHPAARGYAPACRDGAPCLPACRATFWLHWSALVMAGSSLPMGYAWNEAKNELARSRKVSRQPSARQPSGAGSGE